ncbi:pyrroline-5-carboxylate reductase [Kurthia sibirica]|uniref:Pyrroline-5-carboxylate reductase n=1 Tax=Kurthia sibirica TaxID=202750 RepID=A0A2U3ANF7_9BACL|nr:pyrroline-5-carboxylate reductase [Kurthia sibirica]PWI26055.1 pyrroline-5-carboxylate reductase [Kurthia sibirica]GEK34794.1 pyrroline-5-carboxylate reductase [Kurthia sibirica]
MNYAFIGLGNMSQAIIAGMITSGKFQPQQIYGFNRTYSKTAILQDKLQIKGCKSLEEAVSAADVIILGVQPQQLEQLYPSLRELVTTQQLIVSIAAGKSIHTISSALQHPLVARVMPNINSIVGSSTTGFAAADSFTTQQYAIIEEIFNSIGSTIMIPESQFDIFSAIAGASPAFTYLYIDSLARAAVREGMEKKLALQIAADSVLGSAKMVLQSAEHPWELVDQVCSPGGTTIQGVSSLQNNHFASTIYEAVSAVIEKDRILQ